LWWGWPASQSLRSNTWCTTWQVCIEFDWQWPRNKWNGMECGVGIRPLMNKQNGSAHVSTWAALLAMDACPEPAWVATISLGSRSYIGCTCRPGQKKHIKVFINLNLVTEYPCVLLDLRLRTLSAD
jgi:hypothetical protein